MQPTEEDFYRFCVNPALEMRQRVRDELCKLDREYTPISMRSKYPDQFQSTHLRPQFVDPSTIEIERLPKHSEPKDEETAEYLLTGTRPQDAEDTSHPDGTRQKTIHIQEGDTGYSYKNLFGPYLRGTSSIHLADPYIRLEFQIRNFLAFVGIIDTVDGPVNLHLTTSAEDEYQARNNSRKFDEIATSLEGHGITFSYEFSDTMHRRAIESDNGWKIILDRGLDIFQKPDSKYELSEVDQTKRKCRETEIVYLREEG
jgi:ATP-dependent Lon protease